MSDDIVRYLRLSRTRFNRHDEAANEIERLRADRDRWRNWASEYLYTDPECECPLCDEVREAYDKTV